MGDHHDAHNRDLKVFVFTVNYPEELAWMYDLGVDGVFTDFPDKIREAQ
jgi:glycerophosphoryl diester phosphodiesterase